MRVRLNASDAVPGELRRNFLEALDRALAEASDFVGRPSGERPEAIRRIRRATKTMRAMIPLLAGVASIDARAGAERCLAAAAGVLSPVRDRDAMRAIIDRLLGGRDDLRARSFRGELTAALVSAIGPHEESRLDELLVGRAALELGRVRAAAGSWEFGELDVDAAAEVLADSWREARVFARSDWGDGEDDRPHEVRKRCSRLALQVGLLEARDRRLKGIRRRLKRACDLLGEEHDLAMLAERVALESRRFSRGGLPDAVGMLCAAARHRLRESAREVVEEVFATGAKRLRRRIRRALS
jgi:hypothetical protein